jgi:hypothetical protein
MNAAALVTQWQAEGEDWLDELVALDGRMPATDKVYLKSLSLRPKSGTVEANIALEGFARDRAEALKLNDIFLATGDRHHGIPMIEQAAPKEIEYYKWSFNKDIRLADESAKKPKTRSKGAAGQSPERNPPSQDAQSETAQSETARPETARPETARPENSRPENSPPAAGPAAAAPEAAGGRASS